MVTELRFTPAEWYCPNCQFRTMTNERSKAWHRCRTLHGILAPLVMDGTKAKVEAFERDDYMGDDIAPRIAKIITTTDDHQDVTVFAPAACGRLG